jgi:hypothetical protein
MMVQPIFLKDIEPVELNRVIKSSVFGSRMIHQTYSIPDGEG